MAVTGSTDLGNGLLTLTVDADPRVTSVDAPTGSAIIYVGTTTASITHGDTFKKLDDGSTTNVTDPVGLKDNLTATVDPAVGNDETEDYAVGSRWINTTSGVAFVAVDVSTGAAIWEQTTGGGGGVLGGGWRFDSATADADPGSGDFRLNNATQASATQMFVSNTSGNGLNASSILLAVSSGDKIYIQEESDTSRFHEVNVTGAPVDATTYVKIPIAVLDSGADLRNNRSCILLILFAGGGGGGGAVDSVFGRTGVVIAVASDYDASLVDNDSGVTGAFVDDALNELNATKKTIVRTTDNLKTLVAAASAGDSFLLEEGTHAIDTTGGGVTPPADNIQIEGPAGAILSGGDQGGAVITIPTGVDRFVLRGFRILAGTSDTHGINIAGATEQGKIQDLRFEKTGILAAGNSIHIGGTNVVVQELLIENCHFQLPDTNYGINVELNETTAAALSGLRVVSCKFENPNAAGIRFTAFAGAPSHSNIEITNCRFNAGQDGIRIADPLRLCTITNCNFGNQSRSGIHSTAAGWDNCTLGDCVFEDCTVQGILTGGGDLMNINDCHFTGCPIAINADATFSQGSISNNTAFGGSGVAYVIASGEGSVFDGNVADAHGGGGLDMNGGNDWSIQGNVMRNCTGDGMNFAGTTDLVIGGNRCVGNSLQGIVEQATCAHSHITDNNLRGNTGGAYTFSGTNRFSDGNKV